MASQKPFMPSQAPPQTAANMALLMGDVSLQVSRQMLSALPAMPASSVVHDNACGNGVVTQAITETQKPSDVTIHATDIGPTMCSATAKVAADAGPEWAERVHTAVMPAESLSFAKATFSHSYMNFLIFGVKEPEKVAAEMHRTMKGAAEDGLGWVTTWAAMAHEDAVLKAHKATRPEGKVHPMTARAVWSDPEHVKGVLEKAGFEVEMSKLDAILTFPDTDQWARLMWGFLGAPEGGWTQEDEDKFEEAVKVAREALVNNELYESDGKGGGKVKMVANVARVVKK